MKRLIYASAIRVRPLIFDLRHVAVAQCSREDVFAGHCWYVSLVTVEYPPANHCFIFAWYLTVGALLLASTANAGVGPPVGHGTYVVPPNF